MASELIGSDIMNQYDIDNSVVDVYLKFENFDVLIADIEDINRIDWIRVYEDSLSQSIVGTVTVIADGDVYKNQLQFKSVSGLSYHSELQIPDGAYLHFQDVDSQYSECVITYSSDEYTGIELISSEEYESALNGKEYKDITEEKIVTEENPDDSYNYGNDADLQDTDENSEYLLPDSDSRYLSKEDLQGFTAEECRIARNEIYARHGRIFQDEALQSYF